MSEFERFPILTDYQERRRHPDWPITVPLKLLIPHEAQAQHNHGQSLYQLASRGGLSPLELLAVLTDQPFRNVQHISPDDAITQIMKLGGIRRRPQPEFGDRSPCAHDRLDEQGQCRKCGADRRGF